MLRPPADQPHPDLERSGGGVRRGATVLAVLGVVVAVTSAVWGALNPQGVRARPVDQVAAPSIGAPAGPSSPVQAATAPPAAAAARPVGTAAPQLEAPLEDPDPKLVGSTTSPSAASSASGTGPGLTTADVAAGVRTTTVQQAGGARLVTVPGRIGAPGTGTRYRVRVQVEAGLDVDRAAFARFVMATLNDPRSWGHGGRRTFARSDGSDGSRPDVTVVLASPLTSAALCRPLVTRGRLSCAQGGAAILTLHRWVLGTADYGDDRTGYRRYLVNHEVGHVLGRGHLGCPARGALAPVMMQQTKGLQGCRKNSWPNP